MGTKGEGLIIVKEDSIRQLTTKNGLAGNMVESLYVHDGHSVWVGTNKGLSRIENIADPVEKLKIINYDTDKGLPSNMINDIIGFDNQIWLTTDNGLSYFTADAFVKNTGAPPTYITKVSVEGSVSKLIENQASLPYNQNNIRFEFEGICIPCRVKTRYRYHLIGYDDHWILTRNRSVQYTSLPSGDYTFQIIAANEHGVWNQASSEYHFSIKPHITETIWFRVLAISALSLLIIIIVSYIVKNTRKRARRLVQFARLEQQALSASMNPHFVFNALSSIQDFINRNNTVEANEYLVKFSRLIRANLEATKKSEVRLNEELKRLELYLSIEKLRFEEKLNYTIEVASELTSEKTYIPTMILQPFVENAIIHGLLPKEKEVI